ncbi:MAG: hypothetical protein ACRD6R_05365 [Candidatus Polarisedimenticolia bacterium]
MLRAVVFTLAAAAALPGAPLDADEVHAESVFLAVRGEIVDLACYVVHGGKGPQHARCAKKCAEQGQPIGLLTTDGKLYLLFADHVDVAPFGRARGLAGQNAEIKGEAVARDGINGLTVKAVTGL